jgi:hypothetical protein
VFIVKQQPGDTMVIDSVAGHGRTADAIAAFVASGNLVEEINAAGICHFCPDRPILRALRLVKSQGLLRVEELGDVLQVSGRSDLLAEYAKEFRFDASCDGTHAHPEHRLAFQNQVDPGSLFTILEIDNWSDDPAGWAEEYC